MQNQGNGKKRAKKESKTEKEREQEKERNELLQADWMEKQN